MTKREGYHTSTRYDVNLSQKPPVAWRGQVSCIFDCTACVLWLYGCSNECDRFTRMSCEGLVCGGCPCNQLDQKLVGNKRLVLP